MVILNYTLVNFAVYIFSGVISEQSFDMYNNYVTAMNYFHLKKDYHFFLVYIVVALRKH